MNYSGDVITLLFFLALSSGLGILWWRHWVRHVQAQFLNSIKWILLEVRLPRDVFKSPMSMEAVFNAIHQGGGTSNNYAKFWDGKVRNWFSLEIASVAGDVRFYIRTNSKFKNAIEAALYAQYPGIEVAEAEDYTNNFRYDPTLHDVWGNDFALIGEDVIPIRTYVDYKLDKDPKEEFKVDPITPLIEWLGSIKEGEQIWFQILCRALDGKFDTWKLDAQKALNKIYYGLELTNEELKAKIKEEKAKLAIERKTDEKAKGSVPEAKKESDLQYSDKQKVEAIYNNISKLGFEVMIRVAYIANKDKFDSKNIDAATGCLRQFGHNSFNGFKPENTTSFDFPWEDRTGIKLIAKKDEAVARIQKRKGFYKAHSNEDWYYGIPERYFHDLWGAFKIRAFSIDPNSSFKKPSVKDDPTRFVLNTEELATIYHFPGQVASTPSLKRIPSKKAEPPVNLPF